MKTKDGKVWDSVRGRWLVLTPEEWVRQHIIDFLIEKSGVEPHRIGREVQLKSGDRADLVVYDKKGNPAMIIECKAQSVPITREVFEQVARYNVTMGVVPFLAVTNGSQLYCCRFDPETNSYTFMDGFPKL